MMRLALDPFRLLLVSLAGWLNQGQQDVIDYLQEENRVRTRDEIERVVVRMATKNRDWGYRRIQGALANLGHEVARGTIANILREHGMEPAPQRERKTTWKEFLCRHREVMGRPGGARTDIPRLRIMLDLSSWTLRGLPAQVR